jgi:drug/metabolite transporter (DMT)-like permease
VLVGIGIVATRAVVDQLGAASLALLRYVVALVCLLPAVLASRRPRIARRDLVPIGLLGIGQFGVLIALLNQALRHVPSARAALLFATMPLLTQLFAAARGDEQITPGRVAGVLATILGVALALGGRAAARGAAAEGWLGEALVLASAATGALCSVLYRPYLRRYPALPVSIVAMAAAVGFLAVLAATEDVVRDVPHITATGWLAVLVIGTSSGLGYFLWLFALARTTATRVTVFLALSPLTAALLGAWLLGERAPPATWAAVGCVALGLWLAHR